METYKIVRYYKDEREKEVLKRGLFRFEAEDHCNNPETKGEGWFDGFEKE